MDAILKIIQLSQELYRAKKNLTYADYKKKGEIKRIINNIEKILKEIQSIDAETEIRILRELYQV